MLLSCIHKVDNFTLPGNCSIIKTLAFLHKINIPVKTKLCINTKQTTLLKWCVNISLFAMQ